MRRMSIITIDFVFFTTDYFKNNGLVLYNRPDFKMQSCKYFERAQSKMRLIDSYDWDL